MQSGALQGKTRFALGKMQNRVLLVKRFASLFLDRRTEEQKFYIEYHNVHSSKLDAHLIFQCYASSMLFIHASTFVFLTEEQKMGMLFLSVFSFVLSQALCCF